MDTETVQFVVIIFPPIDLMKDFKVQFILDK